MLLAVVEDNPELRSTFVQLVTLIPDCQLVSAYGTAEEALDGLPKNPVDLLIVDLDLPGMSGVELIRKVTELGICPMALVWTIHEDRDLVYAALKAGAVGYILKGADLDELKATLQEIKEGGAPMSPRIARRMLDEFSGRAATTAPLVDLTMREREVLRAVAACGHYKEIATQLGLSTHTVHTHVKNIYRKLQATNRIEALQKAQAMGLIVHY